MTSYVVTRNPATGEELHRYPAHDEAGVEQALADTARRVRRSGRRPRSTERLALLRGVGKLLTERREEYAALITAEMGKPITEALGEVDKCAWNCEVVADLAPGWLADHEVASARVPVVAVLRADRRRLRGDAVELPVLAGAPLRLRRAGGRQRRAAQAQPRRHRLRAGHRGAVRRRRCARPGCSARWSSRPRTCPQVSPSRGRGPAGRGGHADRQRARRVVDRVDRRRGDQEDRARARRVRPVRGARRRRRRGGRRHRGQVPLQQHRPELRVRQAVHRARGRRRRVPRALRRRRGHAAGRRPDRPGHHHRTDGPRRPARRRCCDQVAGERRRRARAWSPAVAPSTAPAATSSRPCWTASARA